MQTLLSPKEIGENIIERCKANGVSVKDYCKSLHLGVNVVYHIRDGHYPRVDTLFKIASGLGCTIEDLCTESAENADNGGENT